MFPLLKALLLCTVFAVCSGALTVDTASQINKLFSIFGQQQQVVVANLNDIKDAIGDTEINSGTSNAVLRRVLAKLEEIDMKKTQTFCKGSNEVLNAFKEVLSKDECTEGSHKCHPDATCGDLLIEYDCTCNEGFTGDGMTCEDVNECSRRTHHCDSHATCTNGYGDYSCECNPGYTGNGYSCEEREKCYINSNCQSTSSCKAVGRTKYCFCKDGYRGDGRTCEDVDECATNNYNCHELASCKNIQGSYSCICNLGFQGNGLTCTDMNECRSGHDCPAEASCTNTYGSFSCSCNSGYRGEGYACEDVDECREGTFECNTNAKCRNIPGRYTCVCNPGYKGNGHTCRDADECEEGGHDCHPHATCSNNVGSFSCACNPGYRGDGHDCEDLCPFERIDDAGCILIENAENTWDGSWDNCEKHGSNLFLAKTVTQFNKLRQYFTKKTSFEVPDWTGFWVGVQEKKWTDKHAVSNREWNDEHCHASGRCCGAMMSGPPSYRLQNDPCEWARPSICQWNETLRHLDF